MADPTAEELEKMTTLEHALKYIGVNNALHNAIKETMGDLTQFKQLVLDLWPPGAVADEDGSESVEGEEGEEGDSEDDDSDDW